MTNFHWKNVSRKFVYNTPDDDYRNFAGRYVEGGKRFEEQGSVKKQSFSFEVLPFAIVFTLLIETVSVVKFSKVANAKKAFLIVGLANLLSFVAPYSERAYRFMATTGGFTFSAAFNKGPYYMILFGYLVLTCYRRIAGSISDAQERFS